MNGVTLKIENLSYFYDGGEGIENFTFELNGGDFLAVIGESGAGKTTLINTILGVLEKNTGEVLIPESMEVSKISFSPQNQAIDWYLNVYDNIYMGAIFSGVEKPREKTFDIIEKIGLSGKEKSDPTELSGGQQQRIQLARQLVSDSEMLFLDEPTNGLDVNTTENILSHIKSLTLGGATCIVSSHDLDMLEQYCNKVLFIENGQQSFFGSLSDFISSYSEENEYIIETSTYINNAAKEILSENYRVLEWNPLRISLESDDEISNVLKILLDTDNEIMSVNKDRKTLKEVFLNKSKSKEVKL